MANLLLAFMYGSAVVWKSKSKTLYTLLVTACLRTLQEGNKYYPITTALLVEARPPYPINAPGKTAQMVQLPLLWIGAVAAIISHFQSTQLPASSAAASDATSKKRK